jgi:hypothetical protein
MLFIMQCSLWQSLCLASYLSLSSYHASMLCLSSPAKTASTCLHLFVVVTLFSVITFLIIGITATASPSREAVLDPPDEETEKSQENEEDDDDDGDDDVAFHCCEWVGMCVETFKGVLAIEWFDGGGVVDGVDC